MKKTMIWGGLLCALAAPGANATALADLEFAHYQVTCPARFDVLKAHAATHPDLPGGTEQVIYYDNSFTMDSVRTGYLCRLVVLGAVSAPPPAMEDARYKQYRVWFAEYWQAMKDIKAIYDYAGEAEGFYAKEPAQRNQQTYASKLAAARAAGMSKAAPENLEQARQLFAKVDGELAPIRERDPLNPLRAASLAPAPVAAPKLAAMPSAAPVGNAVGSSKSETKKKGAQK